MKLFMNNRIGTLRVVLGIIRCAGFLVPDQMDGVSLYPYSLIRMFCFMFIFGSCVITQTAGLIQIWGDIGEMTSRSFILLTNFTLIIKIYIVVARKQNILKLINEGEKVLQGEIRKEGNEIIDRISNENSLLFRTFIGISICTAFGLAASAEKNQLPLLARYPWDLSQSPYYEISYVHQSVAVVMQTLVHVSLDQLVSSLVVVCRCRMTLLKLSLRTIGEGITVTNQLLTEEEEKIASDRLRQCVMYHNDVLDSYVQIQTCFTEPLLVQFTVSMVIICVTLHQLAMSSFDNMLRLMALFCYLIGMVIQVFIYCYQGNHLSEESSEISDAAYECPWYSCSVAFRKSLLIVMTRSTIKSTLTAGGLATLSLTCFVSIIKASYSFFTVLKQMEQ